MSIAAWLIMGWACGFVATKCTDHACDGLMMNTVFGLIGAFLGGVVSCHIFGGDSVAALNAHSLLLAFAGSVTVLLLHNLIIARRTV